FVFFFFFQAEDGIRDFHVTGVQTCALPISISSRVSSCSRRSRITSRCSGGSSSSASCSWRRCSKSDSCRSGVSGSATRATRASEIGRASCRERGEVGGVGGYVENEQRQY